MTSLLTNTAAMVALRTLNDINSSLNVANNRVSTGLRIAEAKDSAAYWAISVTTQSDTSALLAVKDAIAIGKSTLEVTYKGLDDTRASLDKIKQLLVKASAPDAQRMDIQTEINGIIEDMKTKAAAAVINEQNYLAYDLDDNTTKSVIATFERSASGIAIGTIDLNISNVVLIDTDADASGPGGILDKERDFGPATPDATSFIGSIFDLATDTTRTQVDPEDLDDNPLGDLTSSVDDLARVENMLFAVQAALEEVITASNNVGVNLSRAESQLNFVSALIDANNAAVGAIVDANMEEESTRLRALQTQQQLSIESLSIANTAAQNVLTLFR